MFIVCFGTKMSRTPSWFLIPDAVYDDQHDFRRRLRSVASFQVVMVIADVANVVALGENGSGFVFPFAFSVVPPFLHTLPIVLASEPRAALLFMERVRDTDRMLALAVLTVGSWERRLPFALWSVAVAGVHPNTAVASLPVESLESFLLLPREGAPFVAKAAQCHPRLRPTHGPSNEVSPVLLQLDSAKAVHGWRPQKTSGQTVYRFLSGLEDPAHFDVVASDSRRGLAFSTDDHQRHKVSCAVVVLRMKVHAGAGL